VRRLVLPSGRGEEEAQAAEQVVMSGSIEWTVVRCSWFNQNFSEGYLLDPVLGGEVVLPAGDVPEPFVDVDDIADVAVADVIGLLGYLFGGVLDGRNASVANGVEQAPGEGLRGVRAGQRCGVGGSAGQVGAEAPLATPHHEGVVGAEEGPGDG
jgi:uncharacterized protein YbjT (DUF2867 family)